MMSSIFAPEKTGREIGRDLYEATTCPTGIATNGAAGSRFVLDWTRGEIRRCDGHRCKLTALQAALLAFLARKAGTPVSRDELLAQVWQLDPRRTATRRIDMQISQLRKHLGDDADKPVALVTIHGTGYMLRGCVLKEQMKPK